MAALALSTAKPFNPILG